jgi:hypothetical protein
MICDAVVSSEAHLKNMASVSELRAMAFLLEIILKLHDRTNKAKMLVLIAKHRGCNRGARLPAPLNCKFMNGFAAFAA